MPSNDRAALESWLRANGAPWLIVRHGIGGRLSRDLGGLVAIVGFALRWFVTALVRSRSALVGVLPLLLVGVVLSFYSTEFWQTIGNLHGLPIVLVLAMFVLLSTAFVASQAKPDFDALGEFADASALTAALPEAKASTELPEGDWQAPPLRRLERANLLLVSVLAQVLAATVIGAAVAVFFIVLGFLSVDLSVTAIWIGHAPSRLFTVTLAGHKYAMTNQLLRVSAFLGAFAGFYFIVSSTTDQRMRQSSATDHDAHLRTTLAVRSVYRGLLARDAS